MSYSMGKIVSADVLLCLHLTRVVLICVSFQPKFFWSAQNRFSGVSLLLLEGAKQVRPLVRSMQGLLLMLKTSDVVVTSRVIHCMHLFA